MMIWTCAPIYAFLVAGFGIGGEPQDSGVPPYVPVQQAKQQPAKESKRFFLFDRKKNSNHRTESAPRNNAETPIDAIRVTNIESASIPTHLFSGQFKDRAMQILRKPQFHRTGPEETIACDPGLYEWLLDHPIQVAEFWRQAGIDVGSVEEIEGGYFCKDAENGSCKFYTVYSSPEMRVAYCIGESKSSLVPFTLRAEMVLVQRYRFERYPDGKFRLVQQLEGFVTAEGKTLALAMKLARNKSQEMIDTSISNVQVFFSVASRAVQSYPSWAIAIAEKNSLTWPKADTQELLKKLRALPVPPRGVTSRPIITTVPANVNNQIPGSASKIPPERSTFR